MVYYPTSFGSIIYLMLLPLYISAKNDVGFNVNLIRKNTPHYNHNVLPLSGLLSPKEKTPQSPTYAYLGHYLMELSIGTPPFKIYGIVDTGSDLTWTQCVPCKNCYKQRNPMFDPRKSTSYRNISCDSELCHKLDTGVCSPEKRCNYTYGYASAAITQSVLAQETITLTSTTGESVPLKGIVFGCGHNDTDSFNDHEMGIIGLGGGLVSLISQIGSSFGGKRFSQCLVPFHTDVVVSSKMSFGRGSEVSGIGVISTPLVAKEDKTPYFITLLGISVGNTYLHFNGSSEIVSKGNMFLDSGTPPTILPTQSYERVVDQVRKQVAMAPIIDDPDLGPQLCYRTKKNLPGPVLKAHFEGADVTLNPIQTFISPKKDVFCLGFTNTSADGGIYGNFAQSNYLIGFDLDKQLVYFKPMDCTKYK